jgi:hypothetical protein
MRLGVRTAKRRPAAILVPFADLAQSKTPTKYSSQMKPQISNRPSVQP